jgi:prepilin-type N-terminal cleavage/methylation domain-containing protein
MEMIHPNTRGKNRVNRASNGRVEAALGRYPTVNKRQIASISFLGSRGFTLLELLVSMALLSIVILVLLQTTAASLNMWRATERKISAGREGRGALQLIDHDFKNLFAPSNPALHPALEGSTVFRFLTLKPLDFQDTNNPANVGDVCFVEYRITNNAIERGSVDSELTREAMTDGSPSFPTPARFHIVATNVIEAAWMTNGEYVQLFFKTAPGSDAMNNYTAGINTNNQQTELFFFLGKLP